jgi:protein gp37
MVFVNSMSDLFHKDVPFSFVAQCFETMRLAHWHTFQVLTKRPERMYEFWQWAQVNRIGLASYWPLPNVWLGTSVENQEQADRRIPELLKIPAAVRFLSCEPLLGPIDLSCYVANNCLFKAQKHTQIEHSALLRHEQKWHGNVDLDGIYTAVCEVCGQTFADGLDIHWVIVGGESGPNARPMHPDWARAIRAQCQASGVAFFFKQWGSWIHENQIRDDNLANEKRYALSHCVKTPQDVGLMARRSKWRIHTNGGLDYYNVGKKAAGRLLDGRAWDEFPQLEPIP